MSPVTSPVLLAVTSAVTRSVTDLVILSEIEHTYFHSPGVCRDGHEPNTTNGTTRLFQSGRGTGPRARQGCRRRRVRTAVARRHRDPDRRGPRRCLLGRHVPPLRRGDREDRAGRTDRDDGGRSADGVSTPAPPPHARVFEHTR